MTGSFDATPDALEPEAVLAAFGLAGPATSLTRVPGAWSNRVYRLVAPGGSFAVKEMRNPWNDPRWREWLDEAWQFERQAIAAGVAAPPPIPHPRGGCIALVRRVGGKSLAPVRLHRWCRGRPLPAAPVDPEIATWAGKTLATLHGLRVRVKDRSLFPVPNTDTADRWPVLLDAAGRAGASWAGQLAQVAGAVSVIAELTRAGGHRPEEEVMTHGDIDQKNIVVTSTGPVLCDWDAAAPMVPRRELADVALSMGCWERFDLAREVARSYRDASGEEQLIEPADLGQALGSSLDWVAFNVERAIGLRPASPEEAVLAGRLVPTLLASLPRQAHAAVRVGRLLRV